MMVSFLCCPLTLPHSVTFHFGFVLGSYIPMYIIYVGFDIMERDVYDKLRIVRKKPNYL